MVNSTKCISKANQISKGKRLVVHPRSAYNFFYKHQTKNLLKERAHCISLQEITRAMGKRWKEACPTTREKYEKLAEMDKLRYSTEIIRMRLKHTTESHEKQYTHFPDRCEKSDAKQTSPTATNDGFRNITSKPSFPLEYKDKFGIPWSAEEFAFVKMLKL